MKIRRFFASEIRQALIQVKETLGPDAVILSNRSINGGVELVAAKDYDEEAYAARIEQPACRLPGAAVSPCAEPLEDTRPADNRPEDTTEAVKRAPLEKPKQSSDRVEWSQDPLLVEMQQEIRSLRRMMENGLYELSWQDMGARRPLTQELLRRLMGLDLAPDICQQLVNSVGDCDDPDQAWRQVLRLLADDLPITDDSLLEEGGVVALIGPTGVGKTTTVAKLAARFALRHGPRHVALISTDGFRIGAQEQLNTYARILDVPVRTASNPEELAMALNVLAENRLVLIDTAGMSQQDARLSKQLSLLKAGNRQIRSYLTLSANTQQSTLEQTIAAFSVADPDACILTKVDEAASLGGAFSALMRTRLRLAYITDGQKVPEDMHHARANTMISRAATLCEHERDGCSDDYLALAFGGNRAYAHG